MSILSTSGFALTHHRTKHARRCGSPAPPVEDEREEQAEEALVLALACGATVETAARQCGIDEEVVRRERADEKFRRRMVMAETTLAEQSDVSGRARSQGTSGSMP